MAKKNNFITHIIELRNRLMLISLFFIISFSICYFYIEELYNLLLFPLTDNFSRLNLQRKLIYTGLSEAFSSYIRLSFFLGILIIFPYISWHLHRFISPALYKKEKKFFNILIFLSPILFYLGCFFAYYFVFPLAWKFFISFENLNSSMPIELQAKISEYLSLSIRIIIAFGIVFQLPIVLTILIRANIISKKTLANKRKYVFLVFFIIGAIITPPDIISQIAIAIPMYLLFEITLLLVKSKE